MVTVIDVKNRHAQLAANVSFATRNSVNQQYLQDDRYSFRIHSPATTRPLLQPFLGL